MEISNSILEYLGMTTTLKSIYESNLPAAQGFRLVRLIKELVDVTTIFQIERTKLLEKYGTKENNEFIIKDIESFEEEFNNLLKEKITINCKKPQINVNNLEFQLSAEDINHLSNIIEFYEDEN